MHVSEEEIYLFIGCSGGLAAFIPIRYTSESSRCAESRHSPHVKNYLFFADLQLLFVFGPYLF